MNETTKRMRIDIVSDVVCPWCIIGYKRLQRALETLPEPLTAEVHWHPFELNPDMPPEGQNLRAHLAQKYGTTREDSQRARAMLTDLGASLGFTFDYFDDMSMFNTFKAHQLLHHARQHGKETTLKLRLFSAFFGERKNIGREDVLIQEAERVGLDGADARAALGDQRYAQLVRDEQRVWLERGVRGVPTFVFAGRHAVSGAQDPEVLKDIMLGAL